MTIYISNAFSLSMLDRELQEWQPRRPKPIKLEFVKKLAASNNYNLASAIGHVDTAKLLSGILGFYLPPNRVNVNLQIGDHLLVAQYVGLRLPEGATTLPEGATIEWWLV